MEYFSKFRTDDIGIENHDDRIFTGHVSVEVIDKQNEFVAIDEILKVIDGYMMDLPVISDSHTNRMVGRVLSYEKSEYDGHPSIKIRGQVLKRDGVILYDKVWEKVKSGEYSGLSMGGASKNREPIYKNGKLIMNLKDLELYEFALCAEPANPLAIIDYVNEFAKDVSMIKQRGGRSIIQCDSVLCEYDGTNADVDVDIDNQQQQKRKLDILSKIYNFTKPVRGHSFEYWQNKLHRENPSYTNEQVNATIGSWEAKKILSKVYNIP